MKGWIELDAKNSGYKVCIPLSIIAGFTEIDGFCFISHINGGTNEFLQSYEQVKQAIKEASE